MFALQNLAFEVALKQQSETNAGTLTTDNIDTRGYDEVLLLVHGTTSNNATNNPSVLKVQQSDTTDASNFSDITALVGDGAGGFTIPASPTATTTAPYAALHVRTALKKRYLRVLISPATTQTYSVLAVKGRAAQAPTTVAGQNVAVLASG